VDAVESFESIDHFYEHGQFLAEVRRGCDLAHRPEARGI
jgi:hypothetical protein